MTGLDLIRECRRVVPKQKIIMVSGTVDEGIFRDYPSKPDQFLAKPYQGKQLISMIEALLAA
jgi:CheY-like chemotaxis protein